MLLPLPAEAPLAPVCEVTVHANVVPATLLVNAMLVAVPEHIVCVAGVAVATGVGLTVTPITFENASVRGRVCRVASGS